MLACSRSSEEASVAGTEGARGSAVGESRGGSLVHDKNFGIYSGKGEKPLECLSSDGVLTLSNP